MDGEQLVAPTVTPEVPLWETLQFHTVGVMAHFLCQLDRATGCPDSRGRRSSGRGREGVWMR